MLASCPILFVSTGGQLNERGRPLFTLNGTEMVPLGNPEARLNCDRAYDCGVCTLLHRWLETRVAEGYSFGWECDRCLKYTRSLDEENDIERIVTGYYQAGRKFTIDPEDKDFDPDKPGLDGCTHVHEFDDPEVNKRAGEKCGWETSFLQLVLRRRRADGG
jgi:hypothetical protein